MWYAHTAAAKKWSGVCQLSTRSHQKRPRDGAETVPPQPACCRQWRSRCSSRTFPSVPSGFDGITHEHDVVIDAGRIRKRKRKPSKKFRDDFGHTPLSIEEDIPWKCRRLVIGSGAYGKLPVMTEVKREAERRRVELLIVPTMEAIEVLQQDTEDSNAILHVTC